MHYTRDDITKEMIEELYIKQNLAASKCRKILKVSQGAWERLIEKYQIKRSKEANFASRSNSMTTLDYDKLTEQVKELYINQGLSTAETTKRIGVGSPTLSKILRKLNYKRPMEVKLQHMKETCMSRYGVAYNCELDRVRLAQHKSKIEDIVYELLLTKFSKGDVIRQYKSSVYPFPADFYIKSLYLYIEFNPGPRHNKRPFNPLDNEHQAELQKIIEKSKKSDWYEGVIRTWTKRDPLKRKIAKENNLNWKEFFTVDEVKAWLQTV